ncbi:TPA: hypothetical protein P8734_005718 [Pseudomonas aeruginosa]|nr:hypothetical protein [Pseudomonas aeruginosa]
MEHPLKYHKFAGFWPGAKMLFGYMFLVCVVIPSVAGGLLIAAGSGWSFDGVGRWLVGVQAEAQQLGKAAQSDHLLVRRCADPAPERDAAPVPEPVCQNWSAQEVPVDTLASEAGRAIALVYGILVGVGLIGVMIFRPPTKRRKENKA